MLCVLTSLSIGNVSYKSTRKKKIMRIKLHICPPEGYRFAVTVEFIGKNLNSNKTLMDVLHAPDVNRRQNCVVTSVCIVQTDELFNTQI